MTYAGHGFIIGRMTTNLIGTTEAARILGMSRGGVISAADAGRIPIAGRIGDRGRGMLVFDREAVEAEAAARREGVEGR